MTRTESQATIDLRLRYRAYLADQNRGNIVQRYAIELTLVGIGPLIAICSLALGPLVIAGIALGFGIFLVGVLSVYYRIKTDVAQAKLARAGVPVSGVILLADGGLFEPGPINRPSLVLISFDSFGSDIVYLSGLVFRMIELSRRHQSDEDLRYIAGLVTDESRIKNRRRKLPVSFTGGPIVYCADLYVVRACLPQGFITQNDLPCIGLPGDQGGLELLPWQIIDGQDLDPQ